MGSKQCGKCGEVVDDAKAFCPGCGNAFVEEEKRTTVSDFDMSNKTVQLGSTMYNQLLSDMGLSISKGPKKEEGVAAQLVAPEQAAPTPVQAAGASSTRSKRLIWLIIAAIGLLFILVVGLLVVLFLLWQRFA
jgi:hypothetical protein